MVLDPEDPTKIRLDHSAFNFPRESWDKILATPTFRKVQQEELLKLMMCYPETGNWRHDSEVQKHLEQVKSEVSSLKLEVQLPKIKFIDSRLRNRDGHVEFIILAE